MQWLNNIAIISILCWFLFDWLILTSDESLTGPFHPISCYVYCKITNILGFLTCVIQESFHISMCVVKVVHKNYTSQVLYQSFNDLWPNVHWHLTMIIKETQIEQTDPKQAKLVLNEPIYLKLSQLCTIWAKLIQINPKWSKIIFKNLALDFWRFCVVILFFIPATTANDLRLWNEPNWFKMSQNPKWAKFIKKEWNWCKVNQIEQTKVLKLVWFSGPIVNKGTGNCWYEKINTIHISELYSRSNINKMQ